ncbi:autorepressor SdpR family transcription factor [Staphylococcus xylosus]|uniref:autorepressor SdpR family transcription factor n=1 Tax=Staphylococcaceae TaxID=90964 RepID=UPI000D1BE40C|nr:MULTISPECIES: autorepressor SdpR family transcription factor [Staphylococcaceae]MBF0795724.1 winged helix-turn-helix transcriptional regulator [Mammaliicoccus lentus]MBW0768625.1 winged helix-turn-helix transcriptional regulator [Mammaliicoccus lentus]MDG0826462.1 autorepressor SdpR family transcription factor [Staphylococcus equorum]PTE80381.1 transcriptional regulator [Staphylococcus equorum]PTH22800.1 transcriptional regulator [Staphylococcus arlettae]
MKDIFKALSDETRRGILELLKDEDLTAGDIAKHFDMSKPSISQHLKILKYSELITSTKKGQYIFYSLNTSVFEDLLTWVTKFK